VPLARARRLLRLPNSRPGKIRDTQPLRIAAAGPGFRLGEGADARRRQHSAPRPGAGAPFEEALIGRNWRCPMTLEGYALDRFWRNARAHSLHDPARWMRHHIEDYCLNRTMPPRPGRLRQRPVASQETCHDGRRSGERPAASGVFRIQAESVRSIAVPLRFGASRPRAKLSPRPRSIFALAIPASRDPFSGRSPRRSRRPL
jgi:hypothetical protein